jgi:hypothetical protein
MFGIEDGWIVTMLLLILAALLACIGYGVWRWNEEEGSDAAPSSDPSASGGGEPGSFQ